MNIFGRVLGVALIAGVALFLLSLIVKVLLIGAGLFLLARFVGPRLLGGRAYGPLGRGDWQSSNIISIDDPTYRSGVPSRSYERVISIG
jgi:hypothetical protein